MIEAWSQCLEYRDMIQVPPFFWVSYIVLKTLGSNESWIRCHFSPKRVTPQKGFPLKEKEPCTSAASHTKCLQVGKTTSPVRVLMVKEEELVVELRHLWPQENHGAVWLWGDFVFGKKQTPDSTCTNDWAFPSLKRPRGYWDKTERDSLKDGARKKN